MTEYSEHTEDQLADMLENKLRSYNLEDFDVILRIFSRADEMFSAFGVQPHHGRRHAITVALINLKIVEHDENPSQLIVHNVIAAYLHDADDRKTITEEFTFSCDHGREVQHSDVKCSDCDDRWLPKSATCGRNSSIILMASGLDFDKYSSKIEKNLMECSVSKNGFKAKEPEAQKWQYTHFADQLTAIGRGGIERCIQYNKDAELPLFVEDDLKLRICDIPGREALDKYLEMRGKYGEGMIQHFMYKLIHLHDPNIINDYAREQFDKNRGVVLDYLKYFIVNKRLDDSY